MTSTMGTIWSGYIAASQASGIGDWKLDQLGAAMVDGLARDDHHLYSAMPCENYRLVHH